MVYGGVLSNDQVRRRAQRTAHHPPLVQVGSLPDVDIRIAMPALIYLGPSL